jgi:hypothetical protein
MGRNVGGLTPCSLVNGRQDEEHAAVNLGAKQSSIKRPPRRFEDTQYVNVSLMKNAVFWDAALCGFIITHLLATV